MRVISGRFKSRRLKAAPPEGIRPTSDKLKETLFNVLGIRVQGSTFLDGCSGTGGIGIEALSRGAQQVYFVDQSSKACRIVKENLHLLEIAEGNTILTMDIVKALDRFARESVQFDIAFIDPPYDREDLYEKSLERFGTTPLLTADGILILEHSKRRTMPVAAGSLQKFRTLVQGDAALAFYKPETT